LESTDSGAPSDPIEQLEKRKEDLFGRLKGVSSRLRYKKYEEENVRAALNQKFRETGINARELRRRKDKLDFLIATEATTLTKEREMMKEMKLLDKDLEKASEVERMERKLRLVEGDIRSAETEVAQIKKEIENAKAEIKAVTEGERDKLKEEREKEWQEKKRAQLMVRKAARDEEMKKEAGPYMGRIDEEGVDLGSIAVIKKKSE